MATGTSPPSGVRVDEYAFVLFPRAWPELTLAMETAAARLRSQRRPEAALIVERAWSQARQEQIALGVQIAQIATRELRDSERRTRVRPDTDGGGGPRLQDHLRADVMPRQDLLPGSVGVANYDELDREVPWWVTNEIGNTTRIGDKLFGLFYGGHQDSPPNMDEFREHPLFAPAPAAAGGGRGIIQHGIPERRFIKKALPEIERQWKAGFDAIHVKLMAEVVRANTVMR